jgi:hypothetical protein
VYFHLEIAASEMGCTHFTCNLLRGHVENAVCQKCEGNLCNEQLAGGRYASGDGSNGGSSDPKRRRAYISDEADDLF